ncbi:MAG: primosomal protein N' [Lachnospiraceae bacterium]|nr:primosomal protein N' [Lachnospiraceae bacterium]
MFANVIVDISLEKLDKTFQYIIPETMESIVKVGCRVLIPFGKGDRQMSGYVIEIADKPCMDLTKLKEIKGMSEKSVMIESQLISLAWFIKETYGSTMNKALKTVIPIKQSVKGKEKKYLRLIVTDEEAHSLYEKYHHRMNTKGRAILLYELMNGKSMEYEIARQKTGVSDQVIRSLEKQNIIEIGRSTVYRNPVGDFGKETEKIRLNDEQQKAADNIIEDLDRGKGSTHLVFGVTGSGKTEVYMEVIEHVLAAGKDIIVLIPEISLTFQTIKRFYRRFGDIVSIINSKLSQGEKYDQFERAKNGEVKIMIGPRSALFTPFQNLGLIIIDEEHEGAYKSDMVPKYHAREVAIERARLAGANVILGSATPAVSTYYKALKGEYQLHQLPGRANQRSLPHVDIVDMREELESGNRDIFSNRLKKLMEDRLAKNEQIMLFMNRRGYSSFVSCRKCGEAIKCPHCDVSLTLHKKRAGDRLVCHYCGYSIEMPKFCPKCESKYIGRFGMGTEQIEEKISQLFPEAKTLRMDFDTTRAKGDYERILSSFCNREADILVGTQMIVKGHDFSGVTLVGIIAADLSLFGADYMAGERTFQLLTQAAGRAGRGDKEGTVVIQTYNPDHVCIKTAASQNYEAFYNNEIGYRMLMSYPPAGGMMAILISDKNEDFAGRVTNDLAVRIEKTNIEGLHLVGPTKAAVSKINDIYRNVIYLKHVDEKILIKVKNAIVKYIEMVPEYKDLSIQFDFNPMWSY